MIQQVRKRKKRWTYDEALGRQQRKAEFMTIYRQQKQKKKSQMTPSEDKETQMVEQKARKTKSESDPDMSHPWWEDTDLTTVMSQNVVYEGQLWIVRDSNSPFFSCSAAIVPKRRRA